MKLLFPPTTEEWFIFLIIFITIGLFIGIAEFLRQKFNGSPEITRKLVHILTGLLIFFAPEVFYSGIPAILLAILFIVVNLFAVQFDLLQGMHGTNRHSYGTVYYPLSFLILVLLFWDSASYIISISILVLAVGDASAAIVGENLRSPHQFYLTSDKKSFEGSTVMFITTFLIVYGSMVYLNIEPTHNPFIIAAITALFATIFEAVSSRGFDNCTIPLSTAFMLHLFLISSSYHLPEQMMIAIALAAVIGIISVYFKFLAVSGSVATFLLATIVYGVGGWKWTTPILTFFIVSSLLSKLGKIHKKKFEIIFDKTDKRDAGQVAANGGVAGIIIILWHFFPENTELFYFYLASIAAVTADTWGTEIGTLWKGKPRSIVTLQSVEPGTSGGVSLQGTFGALIGAMIVTVSAVVTSNSDFSIPLIAAIVISGMLGSFIDSLFGATIQAQYKTPDGKITEKTSVNGVQTTLVRGIRLIDNDMVNWICALSGAISMFLYLHLF
ncbi:MAG TPA: DUF92 domain-containing protein [Bacteroidetes bacterium]|nr:DUF92 domain-containing protein [Bacteroidota bacterium]